MLWSRAARASTAENGVGRKSTVSYGSRRAVSSYRLLSLHLLDTGSDACQVKATGSQATGKNDSDREEALKSPKDVDSERESRRLDWNQEKYLTTCSRLGITPSQKFLQSLLQHTVHLSRLFLGSSGAFACALALRNNVHLRVLILEDNELGCNGARQLTAVIRDNPFLVELRLVNNRIGIGGLRELTSALIQNRSVQIFDLSGNRFEEKCGSLVRHLLEENKTILELHLGHNNFREEGIVQISHGLAHNCTLRLIDLSWNHIRRDGAISLCDSLRVNGTLRTALFGWNGLYIEGCRSLAKSLPENSCLEMLDISCNRIDIKCTEFLIKGLRGNATLKRLKISQNPLTAENIRAVLTKIEDLSLRIEELDVTGLTVDPQSLAIADRIGSSRAFKIVFGVLLKQQAKAEEADAFLNDDPMMVLIEFMKLKNMRLLDLFLNLDSDGSRSLSHHEFRDGLMTIGVPMSPLCIQRLLRVLDKDGDGEVDYSELLAGQREHRRRMTRIQLQERSVPYEETELGIINTKLRRLLANRERAAKDAREAAMQESKQQQQKHQQLQPTQLLLGARQSGTPKMLDVARRVVLKAGGGSD